MWGTVLPLFLLAAVLPSVWLTEQKKALDEYVETYDSYYSYTLKKKETRLDTTIYTLNMTSLKWLNESEVDRSIWWHELFIVVPKVQIMKDSCLLIPNSGRNDGVPIPDFDYNLDDIIDVAKSTGSCAALLRQIPNQPNTFHKIPIQECKKRSADGGLSCSWWKFLNDKTAQPHTLLQFPMVKATVRAMDTITAFLLKESNRKMNVAKFTLAGISKRGWSSWLTAAVDNRVVSFFPFLADLLNMSENLHHQYRSYCGWTFLLKPLRNTNITQQLDEPRFKEMASHIDPLEYNGRYSKQAKYISVAAGDEIFQPDDSHYYFSELTGEKLFRIIPNIGHTHTLFLGQRVTLLDSLKAFYVSTMQNLRRPQVSWNRMETNSSGIIHLFTDQEPSSTKCYFANTFGSKRRDFRLVVGPGIPNPVLWCQCRVEKVMPGVYKAEVDKPSKGWRGFFIEVTFPGPGDNTFVFTSELHIIPDTFPCMECKGEQCYGKLV
ncbi:autocrine proliferation repressor protein A-like [Sceloporus undulatus]|uniref:autocrine proliferation repressor protein A-like n=1 Tax=Sceloporus undulatus TaxID=8520 RepID=UPI001C4BAA22|nr:autocrine proliferation repressor protein A-like [Sceloporus undulatus]